MGIVSIFPIFLSLLSLVFIRTPWPAGIADSFPQFDKFKRQIGTDRSL